MIREDVVAYIQQYYVKTGKVPSVRRILKGIGVKSASKFYEVFKSVDEACGAAGVESAGRKVQVEKALAARQAKGLEEPSVSEKERYGKVMKMYADRLVEFEYAARFDSSKISRLASEILPKIDAVLWKRFNVMSGGDLEGAYREAVSLCGEYVDRVERAIAEHVPFKDDSRAYRAYVGEITATWLKRAISERRAATLPPGQAASRCIYCSVKLEYCSDGSMKCPSCKLTNTWTREICGGEMKFQEADKLLQCVECGYRLAFSEEILHELDEKYRDTALRNFFKTGKTDPRLKNHQIMYSENGPNGERISTPVNEIWDPA